MYLLLDLSQKGVVRLTLFHTAHSKTKTFSHRDTHALADIDAFLKEEGLLPRDLHGILVVSGIGSFTSSRISAVIANAFAYVLGIPVMSLDLLEVSRITQRIPELLHMPRQKYLLPVYSGEPHLTTKKIESRK